MSTTTAQRRGGKSLKPESTTMVVETGSAVETVATTTDTLGLPSTTLPPPPVLATVRVRNCGTGPFDQKWLNMDCCGLFCAILTYALHFYGVYAVCFVLLPPWMGHIVNDKRSLTASGYFIAISFTALAILAIVSHYQAMTTNPGAVPPDAKPLSTTTVDSQQVLRLCRRCKSFKPQRAHHCSVCGRCIIKMDHHCPWVNNCVGARNQKHFLLFIFYTFLSCIYAILLIVVRFITCMSGTPHPRSAHDPHRHGHCMDEPIDLLRILGLLIESLLFAMFTSCMMFDQASVIGSKITHIDRLKGAEMTGGLPGVLEVFGVDGAANNNNNATAFRWDWLNPMTPVHYHGWQEEVVGYCRPTNETTTESELTALSGATVPSRQDIV